jgi:hypothetical protein
LIPSTAKISILSYNFVNQKEKSRIGGVAHKVEYLPYKHKTPSSNSSSAKKEK